MPTAMVLLRRNGKQKISPYKGLIFLLFRTEDHLYYSPVLVGMVLHLQMPALQEFVAARVVQEGILLAWVLTVHKEHLVVRQLPDQCDLLAMLSVY